MIRLNNGLNNLWFASMSKKSKYFLFLYKMSRMGNKYKKNELVQKKNEFEVSGQSAFFFCFKFPEV